MKKFTTSDYGSGVLRKAIEKKWDVLQVLFSTYITSNEPQSFEASLSSLLVKNRPISLIQSILEGLERDRCFTVETSEDKVIVTNIDKTKFEATYKYIEREYKKFATQYQMAHPSQSAPLDYDRSTPSYDKERHQINFLGRTVPIKQDSQQEEVCILLFMNKALMKKKRHMDELLEKVGTPDDRKKQTSLYRAGVGINENVAKITGVKDLLITSSKYLRVNPKYIKN